MSDMRDRAASGGRPATGVVVDAGAKTAVFATQTGDATPAGVPFGRNNAVFEAKLVSSVAAGSTVTLYGTNESGDITNGVLLGTFALSNAGAGTDKKFGSVTEPFLEVYGVVASTTGTPDSIDFNWVG